MKAARVLIILVLQFVMVFALTSAQQAAASAPERQVVSIDNTRTAPGLTRVCGFTVTRHDVGTISVLSFYANGELVRDVETDHIVTTFTANGHTVTGRISGITMDTYNPDGSYVLLSTGQGDHIVVPGYGTALGYVGNLLIDVDADGNETVIREVGNIQLARADYEAVCAALAP